MKKREIENLKKIIAEEERQFNFNDFIFNYVDEDQFKYIKNIAELIEYLENLNEDYQITDSEIIYYSNAIDYLSERDPSLEDSLELAKEMGYTLENINSEVLASLLKSSNNVGDFMSLLGVIQNREEDIFN